MNVVGRVGSLITQGVYSVATPFHPFGGAIDVIVVQQQDGTFRSTPWYVRFGKFQGVLKGAEKIVKINVNGVEANFHMYLDNSGEAYFVREVESGRGSQANGSVQDYDSVAMSHDGGSVDDNDIDAKNVVEVCRLEHSVSDSAVAQLRQELDSSGPPLVLERAESDVDQRFYEFRDEKSSMDGSADLSEYDNNRFENLEGEQNAEPQGSDSEVILVSVDGHVLTAPVLASEQNTENVQTSTPQFHLGPANGSDEFCPGDDIWAAEYISELKASESIVASTNGVSVDNDGDALVHQLQVCDGDGEHSCQSLGSEHVQLGNFQESEDVQLENAQASEDVQLENAQESKNIQLENVQESEDVQLEAVPVQSDSVDASGRRKRDDVFKSCLALVELAEQGGNANLDEMRSLPEAENSQDSSPNCFPSVDQTENGHLAKVEINGLPPTFRSASLGLDDSPALQVEVKEIETTALVKVRVNSKTLVASESGSISINSARAADDQRQTDEEFHVSTASEDSDSPEGPTPEKHGVESRMIELQATSSEEIQTSSSIRFELSLCGKELHAGMGFGAAAEAFEAHRVSVEEFKKSASSIIKNENLVIRYEDRYLSWEKAAPIVLGMAAFGLGLPLEPKDTIPVDQDDTIEPRDGDTPNTPTSARSRWRLWPIPFRRVKTLEHSGSNSSSEEIFVDSESGVQNPCMDSTSTSPVSDESPRKQFIRTNVPTSEQIASLNLKDGQNNITFSFSTRVLGTQQVDCHIYLWKWNARIVISDVDGTITKSDVLGQFMPLVGKDWTQSGVAKLFCAIKENGYQLLFLSARAIVQAYLTRSFLFNLKQDGKTLPNGPVVISPDGLFPSLYREVIRRAPHEFKIACLEDIKKLFPSDYNPFYAGFGNRDTDELSYRKIGIPKGKIFIINPKGEVAISHRIDVKSYTSLHTLVNDMFPPTSLVEQEDYNSWNFWRVPLPDIE
ncbi:hypothetical protein Tsubulata_005518 [Turnera subulata]|uniref:phosphatidate phosphatase n=1 Tax=Turnera subulata TaxID=218843 RepID=A0A9Q0FGV4_9ROSI|nr:hypothetical protein Tsubulata_005518 [Turnera subulata]